MVHQQLNSLLFVRNLTEGIGCKLAITSGVEDLRYVGEGNGRALHLNDLVDFGPEELIRVTSYDMRKVQLLIQLQRAVQVT